MDVDSTIKKVQEMLAQETHLSPALRSMLDVLILVVQLLVNRLSLAGRNSSKPPSKDRFPARDNTAKEGGVSLAANLDASAQRSRVSA